MGAKAELDFTALLDDLLAASAEAEEAEDDDLAPQSLHVDMLAQIERLRAHSAPFSVDRAMREYRDNATPSAGGERPSVKATSAGGERPSVKATAPDLQPALEDLFFLDPQSISRELGLDGKNDPAELDRARRAFAMRYHPDRVPEEMRERAVLRMQIANMLIDEAKRRKR